jgi:AraC-like DNA-binding protein
MDAVAAESAEQLRLARLRQARDLIDRGYAGPLDLRALAREAGYSPFHFARSFREAYGATPGQYLTRRRVERARELLRLANLTVTEVCYAVGFASLGSFSARFKQQVGASPTVYRDEAVRRGGPPPVPGCFVLMWTGSGVAPRGQQSGRSRANRPPCTVAETNLQGGRDDQATLARDRLRARPGRG